MGGDNGWGGRLVERLHHLVGGGRPPTRTISRADVINAFRSELGRLPESEAAIAAHVALADRGALMAVLRGSAEYATRIAALGPLEAHIVQDGEEQCSSAAPMLGDARSNLRILIYGNCQAIPLVRLLQAMTGCPMPTVLSTTSVILARMQQGKREMFELVADSDLVLVQGIEDVASRIEALFPEHAHKVRRVPVINFSGFHPDIVYVTNKASDKFLIGPMSEYHSALALAAWKNGLSVTQAVGLFREDVFAELGYFTHWELSRTRLGEAFSWSGLRLDALLRKWTSTGCWMYSVNHPKHRVLADLARSILHREGLDARLSAEEFVPDHLATDAVWPVYPEIAKALGIDGNYLFKCPRQPGAVDPAVLSIDLAEMVSSSYAVFNGRPPDGLACVRVDGPGYQDLDRFVRLTRPAVVTPSVADAGAVSSVPASTSVSRNPYSGLPDYQFWRRGVERCAPVDIDPVVQTAFQLQQSDRVATAGSCFAQHISNTLRSQGFRFLVTEGGSGLSQGDAARRQFGLFSARFGNLYTSRQLLQLFERAFGEFHPADTAWQRPDGRWVDPFRPQVEPDGFADAAGVASALASHLPAVRNMFESLDVLVFTLGLTEAWRNRRDGAVFPLAPGVVAGSMDDAQHEFVNFGVDEICADLQTFVRKLRLVNPGARMILTVSPVPLIATYEARHVLVSNTASKAVLRVAAERIVRQHEGVDYFPSFEVITAASARGRYYENDLRSVTAAGVNHVMRVFLRHYAPTVDVDDQRATFDREAADVAAVFCDERALDAG